MRRLSGFSLMEMMTVLLIVSVVAAASAPMINKRMMVSQGAGDCVWERLGDSIFFNENAGNRPVIIGANATNNGLNPKLHIRTTDGDPFITFQREGVNNQLALRYRANTLGLSANEPADGATVIGANANARGANAIAIGANATAIEKAENAIAIGANAQASVAINAADDENANNAIAIGANARAYHKNAIAIGQTLAGQHGISIGSYKAGACSIVIGGVVNPDKNNKKEKGLDDAKNGIYIGNDITSILGTPEKEGIGEGSIAIGNKAKVVLDHAIALGAEAEAYGPNTISIGRSAVAGTVDTNPSIYNIKSSESIAIGKSACAHGQRNIAIGTDLSAGTNDGYCGYDNTAIGHGASIESSSSIAIGPQATVTENADNSIAIGLGATVKDWKAGKYGPNPSLGDTKNAIAIGYNAIAEHKNAVAIGANAHADYENHIELGTADSTVIIKGTLYVSNQKIQSDRRLKNVGKAFTSGLAEIKKLEVFNYTFKKDESKTPRVGVMAQDLQKIFPNAVTKGEDGFLRIRMEDMFYAVVNAVKELANMFDKQDERIVQLEKENKELHKTINDLEKRLEKLEKQK